MTRIGWCFTAQKMKFSVNGFHRKLRTCSHLLKKSLTENRFLCNVSCRDIARKQKLLAGGKPKCQCLNYLCFYRKAVRVVVRFYCVAFCFICFIIKNFVIVLIIRCYLFHNFVFIEVSLSSNNDTMMTLCHIDRNIIM